MSRQTSPLKEHVVVHGDVRIRVTACGSGAPVVLLPSLGRDIEDFHVVAQALAAEGLRALMPSPRGMNGSSGPLAGITLHDFADDIAAVIRHDGNAPALVAGHAFGNWVARTTATDYPELVSGVAVLAAAHKDFPRSLRLDIDGSMNPALPREQRLAHLRAAFFAPGSDPGGWLEGWFPDVVLAQRAASAATPTATWWPAGTAPLLDVQADSDPFAPQSGTHLLRDELGADRVSIVLIKDAGHALLPEQPEAVARVLASFAKRQRIQ